MAEMKTAIGLMSGTSMDGIDVALLRTDGDKHVERGPSLSLSYDSAFRERLKQALEDAKTIGDRRERPGCLVSVEQDLTLRHAEAVGIFIEQNGLSASSIDVIGFHGQTVLHRPDEALTVQIGDGALLARRTGIATVYDMRANDMVHGGQGAPLIPIYHAALAAGIAGRRDIDWPVVFVNIGGISNLTYVDCEGQIAAFDSGPGNTLIDQWVESQARVPYDQGGRIAARGQVLPALAERYLSNPFFKANTRRSLDRNDFRPPASGDASLEDGARTLAHVTAAAILLSATHLPYRPTTYIVSGGGRLNRIIMDDLTTQAGTSGGQVLSAEDAGLNGDSMEAEAWAYLAVRSVKALPLTFPETTGVAAPVGGGLYVAPAKMQV